MTFEEITKLHDRIRRGLNGSATRKSIGFYADLAGIGRGPRNRRLSFGYSSSGSGFRPELRVYTKTGDAVDIAFKIKEEFKETRIMRVANFTNEGLSSANGKGPEFLNRKTRPLFIGQSVSHRDGFPGSIGGFVRSTDTDKVGVLSCDHILSHFGKCRPGTPVHQPATRGRGARSKDEIGVFSAGIHASQEGTNEIDAAFAELADELAGHVEGNFIPKGFDLHYENEEIRFDSRWTTVPTAGSIVEKVGKATGHTSGFFMGAAMQSVLVEREGFDDLPNETFSFDNVLEVQWKDGVSFAQPGDSGSLVFYRHNISESGETHDEIRALGLVFAGAKIEDADTGAVTDFSYVCSLKTALEHLDLEWISAGKK